MGRLAYHPRLILTILSFITAEFACCGDTHVADCLESDGEALIDFKRGLNDPEKRLLSWQGQSNCCQWWGIGCDNGTGAVVTIDLHNPHPLPSSDSEATRYQFWNLSGDIRPSLLKLKLLRHMDLSFNTFRGIPIPEFLGALKNLRYLNLSNAGFSGTIPPSFGNLTSLQYFDVSTDSSSPIAVDDLQWMAGLVSLKHLEMKKLDLSLAGSNWVEVLNFLPFLIELHLSECGLSGPVSSLGSVNFTSLQVIDLSFNSFNSKFPYWLANLSSLVYIDLSYSALHGRIPLFLSELPSLRYLNLAGNNNLSAGALKFFRGSWRKIEVLDLASNNLHGKLPSSIGNLTFLTHFNLFSNNIDGGIPSSIGRLCNLIDFDLAGNNLTGGLPELLDGTENCVSKSALPSLMHLRLSNNQLVGKLPEWLGELKNLEELGLNYNLLEGSIPASLGTLRNLNDIRLGGNKLNGTLPESFGQLSKLSVLDVSSNHLTSFISEVHFSKLSKLEILDISSNSFILNVSSNWIPQFHVRNLDMGSCHLGPSFPAWLESQKELQFLDISNASISDSIPTWFWDISSNLSLLNVSFNQLHGQLPNPLSVAPFSDLDFRSNFFKGSIPLPVVQIELLDLSDNQFSGPIPQNISEYMPDLIFLSVSRNQLTGEIPASIGEMLFLQSIDLSWNNLTGSIPPSIGNCSYLKAFDLQNNNLSGGVPSSLGQLKQLQSLHLNDNNLSGEVPSSFINLSSLETLDLGNNRLSGDIPTWFGYGFKNLKILRLRSNAISGDIPTELSHLISLQVLDLAWNNLTGNIPASLGDLKAVAQEPKINKYMLYGAYRGRYYEESLVVNIKGGVQKFTKILSLLTSIDLSGNNLTGGFPMEITKLVGLVVLNLSRNQISGQIPENISGLHQLSSLDLSNNKLSGGIPLSMPSLTFLSHLNLSDNNLSGRIPYTGQMTTYSESAFARNPGLCGDPLLVKCQGEDSDQRTAVENDNSDEYTEKWFYLSIGLGFAVGILGPHLILATRAAWSNAYFSFVDKVALRLLCMRNRTPTRYRNHNCRRS